MICPYCHSLMEEKGNSGFYSDSEEFFICTVKKCWFYGLKRYEYE